MMSCPPTVFILFPSLTVLYPPAFLFVTIELLFIQIINTITILSTLIKREVE